MKDNLYLFNMSSDEFFARLKETFAEAMFVGICIRGILPLFFILLFH